MIPPPGVIPSTIVGASAGLAGEGREITVGASESGVPGTPAFGVLGWKSDGPVKGTIVGASGGGMSEDELSPELEGARTAGPPGASFRS